MDPARQRGRRGGAGRHLRPGEARRRDADRRRAPPRARPRRGGRGPRHVPRVGPGRPPLQGPCLQPHRPRGGRVPDRRRRFRHHRGRDRPRPHRPGLRRGRLRGRLRERDLRPDQAHDALQPGRPRRQVRQPGRRVRGTLRQGPGGDQGPDRRPRRARPAVPRAGLRARLPALLALRHPAPLLREVELVRGDLARARRPARQQRADRVAPRAHQARPVRQMAREQRRLGALPRPLLGDAAADLGVRRRGLP